MKLILAFFLLAGIGLFADGVQPAGAGTETNPYQVETLDNLLWVSTNSASWNSYFIQTADIDASETESWNNGAGFSPIGIVYPRFYGTYNGYHYTISGLYIDRPNSDYQGLFGFSSGAVFENIGIINADINGNMYVGGLVGWNNSSTIYNCYSTSSIEGDEYVGGLVGCNTYSTISRSYSNSIISGSYHVGGCAGSNMGGTVIHCYNTGNVDGNTNVGGVIGINSLDAIISNCYNTADIDGNADVGGVSGSNSFNSNINNSYNIGNIDGSDDIGGLVGRNYEAIISNCYSIGTVNGNEYVGAVIGINTIPVVSDNFWDTETSMMTVGVGFGSNNGVTAKTTVEMHTQSTFTDAGWDFIGESVNGSEDYWDIDASINSGYPYISMPVLGIDDNEMNEVTVPATLEANYPNPFNPETTISFSISKGSTVELAIYNIKGQKVKMLVDKHLSNGSYSVVWYGDNDNGVQVVSGIYFYKLSVDNESQLVKKCLLLK
jgi:FlgD Ig-like domain/The GLUG motif